LDATGRVLDTRSMATFNQGQYLVWNLSGHVTIQFTHLAGWNAVAAGVFFGAASATLSPTSVTLSAGQQQTFTATVPGGASATWKLTPASGIIVPTGPTTAVYTAPTSISALTSTTITATSTADPSVSVTASVTLTPLTTQAAFLRADDTTQGNWKGSYGAGGANVVNDSVSYPSYAQVTVTGQNAYTWNPSTTDLKALQKASAADRIAATYYSNSSFTIDVNMSDGQMHDVALYCLDYDTNSRAQIINVLDAATGRVLDSRSVTGFSNGRYLVWSISGHVTFQMIWKAGNNAVVSGIFIGK
jgi:hypothetical protein